MEDSFSINIDGEKYNLATYNVKVKTSIENILKKYNKHLTVIVQVIPKNITITERHMHLSMYYALRSVVRGENITKHPYMEFLLYLFGNRQISKVLNVLKDIDYSSEKTLVIASKEDPNKVMSKIVENGDVEVIKVKSRVNYNCLLCKNVTDEEKSSFYGGDYETIEKALILRSVILTTKL